MLKDSSHPHYGGTFSEVRLKSDSNRDSLHNSQQLDRYQPLQICQGDLERSDSVTNQLNKLEINPDGSDFEKISFKQHSQSNHSRQAEENSSLLNEDKIVNSIKSGDIPKKKRIIMRFPDGTYSHALQFGDADSWLEMKLNNETTNQQNGNVNRIQILQIEDEVEYIINNIEFRLDPEQSMKKYNAHRRNLKFFLIVNLLFEIMLYYYLFSNMDFIVSQLSEIYRDLTIEKLYRVFEMSNGIDMVINVAMYTLGYIALSSHKITIFNAYHWVLMMSIFSRIVISYLNILNLLMFIMKIVLYLYSRYVLSLLYSVLLLPNPMEQP
eukprot:403332815